MATPRYSLQEPFYDNLILWDTGDEIEWAGAPSPTMVPLNDEAEAKMTEYMASLGKKYVPPLSEIADTLDGRVTVAAFEPGNRRAQLKKMKSAPPMAKTPGRPDAVIKAGARRVTAEDIALEARDIPQKAPKNFDRAPK